MLSEPEIAGLFDGSLAPEAQARLLQQLETNPELRRQLREQFQMDNLLRVAVGGAAADERVKRSILAVVRGEPEAAIKQRVLEDTTFFARSNRRETEVSWLTAGCQLLSTGFSRPAWAMSLAAVAVCFFVGLWLAGRPDSNPHRDIAAAIELPTRVELPSGVALPKLGTTLRVGAAGSGTVQFADGTVLHLEPGTEVSFQAVTNPPRPGGKQLKLLSGSLSAAVAKQPTGLPLLIETPHALVTVVGTKFDLSVATNQTELEVSHGLVKLTGTDAAQPVNVAAGEFAVAAPHAATRYGRLARHPFLWPFSSTSIWNRPLGSGAQFAPVPGKSFLAEGALTGALRVRRPFLGSPNDPLRRLWVNGEARTDIRLADSSLPGAGMADSLVLLQHARRYALEARGVTARADGDLDAADLERVPLNGPGRIANGIPALPFGLSNLGGLLRTGELETGIRHALAARVSRDRLAGRVFPQPLTVWPAAGNPASDADAEKLCIGALLAIPANVDIRAAVGASGPAYELARAMQDYGVYVTGFMDAPFVLLTDDARWAGADELLTRLVPLLQVVTNNAPETPGGGGTPRREPAPALPDETP